MDFSEKTQALAGRSMHAGKHALTEEATKTAVILPLLQALGYDVFNLEEVIPEFIADVGIKKGEKIDFAIKLSGKIAILVEVKPITLSLGSAQYSQLFRYFGTTEARLAILTNGREIWFFSDLDEPNKMDKKPFFVFDLQEYDDRQLVELARFERVGFDLVSIREAASNLKYVKSVADILTRQLSAPDDEFVKYFARQLHDGSMTKVVLDQYRPAISQAFEEVIRRRIQDRLNVTFGKDAVATPEAEDSSATSEAGVNDIETTDDERMAFMIVQAIASKTLPPGRLTLRDAKSYCAVFVDDNNRRPVCRFYFNAKSVKYVGILSPEKEETRYQIADTVDLYKYCDHIESTVLSYR